MNCSKLTSFQRRLQTSKERMEVRQMTMTLTTVHGPGSRVRRYLTKRQAVYFSYEIINNHSYAVGQRVIALRICPRGFTLTEYFCRFCLRFALSHPPLGSWKGSWYLTLHWEFGVLGAKERWPMGGWDSYPFICILPISALLTIGT